MTLVSPLLIAPPFDLGPYIPIVTEQALGTLAMDLGRGLQAIDQQRLALAADVGRNVSAVDLGTLLLVSDPGRGIVAVYVTRGTLAND